MPTRGQSRSLEWKPEPGVEGRKDEHERKRLGQRDARTRRRRAMREHTCSRRGALPAGACARERAGGEATSQPRTNATASRASPATFGSATNDESGGSGSAAPVGKTPVSAADPEKHAGPRAREACVFAKPAAPALNGRALRRPRASRSRTPSANGTIATTSSEPHGPPACRALLQEDAVRCAERGSDAARRSSRRAPRWRARADRGGARRVLRAIPPTARSLAGSRVVSEIAAIPSVDERRVLGGGVRNAQVDELRENRGQRRRLARSLPRPVPTPF